MPLTATRPPPLSALLVELSKTCGPRVSFGQLAVALTDRSFAALLILFAAPNLVPLPPGSSTVFGIPLILIASQLLLGRPRPWLPRVVRDRSIDRETFIRIVGRLEPILQRFEKLARPRYWPLAQTIAERLVGALVLVMALVLAVPIPFGNGPPAVAIILVSLGLTERDGVWLGLGALMALVALGIAAGVLGSLGLAAISFTN